MPVAVEIGFSPAEKAVDIGRALAFQELLEGHVLGWLAIGENGYFS